ncbi:MAG: hypothetical protein KGM98_06720 [Bacteroidota bacterium]|nr:hypothetical protein [Bacteroidota bacterium]
MWKQTLLHNWNFMRIIRLAIGVWALVSAIQTREPLVGFMGLVLMGMALLNQGCCGASGCNTYTERKPEGTEEPEEAQYEEVK